MSEFSSVNTVLKYSTSGSTYNTLGTLLKLEPPSLKQEAISYTPITGTSPVWGKKIASGVIQVNDFKATFTMDSVSTSLMSGWFMSGSAVNYEVDFPNAQKWQFPAVINNFAPVGSSDKPELSVVEVTFGVSGSMVLS
jgi:hypothetical protein